MRHVFDLDGTLLDNRRAVREAYREAGVIMPDDAWGRPWQEWLDSEALHKAKNLAYPVMLGIHGRPLPPLRDLERALAMGDAVEILTSASEDATQHALAFLGHPDLPRITGASRDEKYNILSRALVAGTYYDDDVAFARRVRTGTGWVVRTVPWL